MSWKRMPLGKLCLIEKGKVGIKKAIPGEFPLVVTAEERLTHNEYHFEGNAVVIPLVSSTGHGHKSLKRIHFQSGKFAVGSILCAVIPKNEDILRADYLYRFLYLNKEKELVGRMRGMANVTLPIKEIAKIEIPVPPIEEQIKFVNEYNILEEKNALLSIEFTYQLDLVKQLRQAFLREAMQGKLVPQNPDDEPASVLLEKIKTEKERLIKEKKIKKPKPLLPIKEEEIPFEIPENWVWCRLGTLASIVRGGSPRPAGDPKYYGGDIPFLKVGDLTGYEGKYCDAYTHTIKETGLHKTRFVDANTLMLTNSGATLGVPRICNFPTTFNDGIAAFLGIDELNKEFLFYFLKEKSDFFIKEASRGQGQPNLNTDIISHTLIAFPSLFQQNRIVAKLDELMQYCDQLEEQIKTSQRQNDLLLQQVLHEALQPQPETEEEELPMAAELKVVYKEPKAHKVTSRKCDHAERAILAGHIINKTYREDFGRVKFQKLLHLTEYHCQIDIGSNYVQKVAGPYDRELIKDIESTLKRFRFFEIRESKRTGKRVTYRPLAAASELDNFFRKDFSKEAKHIDSLLNKFARFSYEECEIISTLYAVWNNRIIREQPIADELLKQDFLEWDKHKAKYTDRLDKALEWMEKEDIIPVGWGKLIEKPVVQE